MKPIVDPSRKVFIETASSATGEQRDWFGFAARRYLTTRKSHDECNGKSSEVHETHLDTWVLDFPVPPHVQGIASPIAYSLLSSGSVGGAMKVPDIQATHTGPRPHGLVVWLKSNDYESEVVALSIAPTEQDLFEVPKGFDKATSPAFSAPSRAWSEQIALEWLRLRFLLQGMFGS